MAETQPLETSPEPTAPRSEESYKAGLLDLIYSNPDLRKELMPLVKRAAPHVSIPEVDTPELVKSLLTDELKEVKDELHELRQERTTRSKRERVLDAGFEASDVEEIEKIMKDHSIGSFDTAVEFYKMQQQTAAPRNVVERAFQVPAEEGLIRDPKGWAQAEALKAIAEVRGKRR